MGYTQFPANIAPVKEYNGWFTVRYGVGETLFKMDDQLQIQPWLATKGEQLSPLEWEITIRQGVRFHDGSLMTPKTVKESLEHLLAANQRAAGELMIERITATDHTDSLESLGRSLFDYPSCWSQGVNWEIGRSDRPLSADGFSSRKWGQSKGLW